MCATTVIFNADLCVIKVILNADVVCYDGFFECYFVCCAVF